MIRFTTLFHLIVRIFLIVCAFAAWAGFSYLLGAISSLFGILRSQETAQFLIAGLMAVVFMACLAAWAGPFLDAIASYFYIREDLKTKVSFAEAKALSFLFTADSKGKWYPASETRKLPEEQRKSYLFGFAKRISG